MSKFHLVKTYFHRRSPQFDRDWLEYRLSIYEKYTLRSLKRQTFTNFTLWICCETGMEEIMGPLRREISGATFTFGAHFPASAVPPCDWVYVTRIDSDDLYSSDALKIVDSYTPSTSRVEASIFQRGYIHSIDTEDWGIYYKPSSPFHCVMFPRDIFVDEESYRKSFIGDHSKVQAAYPSRALPEFKFCVLIHGRNWSSTFSGLCCERVAARRLEEYL
jgi:hypothetical protein